MDAILCFSVLQYAERDLAIAEMRRVLKAEGRVVVVENLAGSPMALARRGGPPDRPRRRDELQGRRLNLVPADATC